MRCFAVLALLLLTNCAQARSVPQGPYADSTEGFQQQLQDFVALFRSGDQAAFRARMETLAIPHADDWIRSHFAASDIPQLQREYPLALAGFQRHFYWVIENAAQVKGWDLMVKASELPRPPNTTGPEAEIPSPMQFIAVENFRYGPAQPESGIAHSFVNSFIYLDGCFRFVGGTYPFWAEELSRLRGPVQAAPLDLRAARLIYHVNPEYPKKARKEHVEGTVRIHALIGQDGVPHDLQVVSGDPLLVNAAIDAVKKWRYEPTLLGGQPVEVSTTIDVIFRLNR